MKTITITNKEMELVEACVSMMHSNANFADQKAILSLLDKIKEQTSEEVTPIKAHQMKNVSKLIHKMPHPFGVGNVSYDSIDLLRSVVEAFDGRNEYLNTDKSIEQLVDEYIAYRNGECDLDGNYFEDPVEEVTPQDAQELLTRVRTDLDRLIAVGESYAHFQSAQATHKYLKKAKKNLEGLS